MKESRKAVRCFCINDGKVVCIKYRINKENYYDIPGGKIEEGETPEQAAIREFKEEAGVEVQNIIYRGIINASYPTRDFQFAVFLTNTYQGTLKDNEENFAYLLDIKDLLNYDNRFPCIIMLEPTFRKILLDSNKKFELNVNLLEDESIQSITFNVTE